MKAHLAGRNKRADILQAVVQGFLDFQASADAQGGFAEKYGFVDGHGTLSF
jgi:hypothetical protein